MGSHLEKRFGLKGQIALVTGGTKGIGKAIVEDLAGCGAQVFTCARSQGDLDALIQDCTARGLDVQGMTADLSSKEGRDTLMEKVKATYGALHILVNNVGTNVRLPTLEYSNEQYESIMSTNLTSAFILTQLAHPLLKAAGRSSIVMIGSVAGGPLAVRSGCIYSMTKAAMDQLTRYLACEWAADGIRVNSVKPAYIDTPLAAPVLQNKALMGEIEERTPMRRMGQPEEISGLVTFLCSEAASYITGQGISVCGGLSPNGLFFGQP